jgi:potassium uptake TrkH family protein
MPFFNSFGFLLLLRIEKPLLRTLIWIRSLGTMVSLALMVYYFGFPLTVEGQLEVVTYQNLVLAVFALSFVIRWLYARLEKSFLQTSSLETLLLGLWFAKILCGVLGYPWFVEQVQNHRDLLPYAWFVHILAMGLAGLELVRLSTSFVTVRFKPATTLLVSFLVLIGIGAGLLMLPQMSNIPGHLPFADALFTSVSATCVTGLSTIDVGTALTFKGQCVLLALIQLGGIGILTFATFFALFLKKGVGISHQAMIKDFMSEESLFDAKKLLSQIIFYSVFIELGGAALIYLSWPLESPMYFRPMDKAFHSIFHSISAFNNAGFSLYKLSLAEPFLYQAPMIRILIAMLIILGGLGFPVLRDLLGLNQIRARLQAPWKQWKLSTRISVWGAFGLLLIGTVVFIVLEQRPGGTLAHHRESDAWVDAFFASASARTAGFNTLDVLAFSVPSCLLMIFLMFIGGGSGSTAGGIKTSTFALLLISVWSTIRNKKQIETGGRSIPFDLLNKAYMVFFFSATYVFICIFVMTIIEPGIPVLDLVFEEVSAFCTVGLSRGPTMEMGQAGRAILMLSMYIGRVGTLTLAFALASQKEDQTYSYPKAHVLIG